MVEFKKVVIYILVAVVILSLVAYFLMGATAMGTLLKALKNLVIWVIVIGIAFYAVWYFFIRKPKDDRVHLNAQRVIQSAQAFRTPFLRDLFISGDKNHPQVRMGKILGYTRIINVKGENEDVFVYKRSGFPMNLFEEFKAIRVRPEKHTKLIGDVIIEAISVMKYGGFLYINQDVADLQRIDQTIISEVKRTLMFDMLSDWKNVVDDAIAISPEHQKALEKKDLLKIPGRQQEQQNQGQGGGN